MGHDVDDDAFMIATIPPSVSLSSLTGTECVTFQYLGAFEREREFE